MPDVQEVFRMATHKVEQDSGALERQFRRRDRRNRNRRRGAFAAAAALGLAAVLLAASIRTTSRTAPAVTDQTPEPSNEQLAGFSGLPPEGATPSSPEDGEVVSKDVGVHPWYAWYAYSDGRVIWLQEVAVSKGWLERRLTPEGIERLRSGHYVDPASELPESAWEDSEAKPYVPSRYVVCTSQETIRSLPPGTQDLLRGSIDEQAHVFGEENFSAGGPGSVCPAVTTEEARTLDKTFVRVGFGRGGDPAELAYTNSNGDSLIILIPLLPNGTFAECCPG